MEYPPSANQMPNHIRSSISGEGYLALLYNHAGNAELALRHDYPGQGTADSPYLVGFFEQDPRNPITFSPTKKWSITLMQALSALAVAFSSSAYSGSIKSINQQFHVETSISILGISLFVLGFALGPLLWAPLSEIYGRQRLFIIAFSALTFLNAIAVLSRNIETLLVLRFLAGSFGSAPLTNAGGVIADMFSASERAVAGAIFAAAPFLGPSLGKAYHSPMLPLKHARLTLLLRTYRGRLSR